jgi:hypothetical protein
MNTLLGIGIAIAVWIGLVKFVFPKLGIKG